MAMGDAVVFRKKNQQYFVYNMNKDPFLCKLFGFMIHWGVSSDHLNAVLQELNMHGYQYQIISQSPSGGKVKSSKKRKISSSGTGGTSHIASTQFKTTPNSNSAYYSSSRHGGGWVDGAWVPGLPSSRFYRKKKHF